VNSLVYARGDPSAPILPQQPHPASDATARRSRSDIQSTSWASATKHRGVASMALELAAPLAAETNPGHADPEGTSARERLFALSPLRGDGAIARRAWRTAYVRRLVAGDVACALLAAVLGLVVKFGAPTASQHVQRAAFLVALCLPLFWPLAMLFARAYEQRFLWEGAEEFRRVFWASIALVAGVGAVSWAFKMEVARGFVIVTLPLVMLLTLAMRLGQRRHLRRQRRSGQFQEAIVIVGHADGIAALHRQIERVAYRGYRVVGCCVAGSPELRPAATVAGLPVLGGIDDVVDVVRRHEVDTVAVLPSSELSGDRMRDLGWALEHTSAELLLAPAVTEVAGPRVHIRPVFGLPLMHVERPEIAGHRRLLKELFDRSVAASAILAFSPALLALSIGIKLTSRGPVFFKHERVGRNGEPFRMLKFRTMYDGAHREFDSLLDLSDGNAVQFKMKQDPRVTPIGRFLRRFSIDELPQLFNVLVGSMSLVGPRPHVTREVEQYGDAMRRRLLVKPGMTGLWQVSGRSDLSWSDSVRLDTRYVENWSMALDLMILTKTIRAVLQGSGAY
jgi:exopolysaccharide biosynthesis polyprenyl glycosylphosphotransferase